MVFKLRILICIFSLALCWQSADAQKVLQLEKKGKIESSRFYIGDYLQVQLEGDDAGWLSGYIINLIPENNLIIFDFGNIQLEDIAVIRTPAQESTPKSIRNKLAVSGASFILLSPLNLAIGEEYPIWAPILGGALIATGFLSELVLKQLLEHKIGRKKQLRILDLTFHAPDN